MTTTTFIIAIVFAFFVGAVVSWKVFDRFRYQPLKKSINKLSAGIEDGKRAIENALKLVNTATKMMSDVNARLTTKKVEEELILSPFQVNIPGTRRKKREGEED